MFRDFLFKHRLAAALLLAVSLGVFSPTPAFADGIIIPDPPPGSGPPLLEDSWLTISYHRVNVVVENQVATTHIEQEFLNEHSWEVEGRYVFPLPQGAAVSDFRIWVDGSPVEGEILPAAQARKVYEDIVRHREDPALLEYVGRDAVQARIFPIPPGGSRKMELSYDQVLRRENGMVAYSYPLNTEKFSARPLDECAIRVEINSQLPIRSVYSPTHQDRVVVNREDDHHVLIGYEETQIVPDQDFELIYTVSQEDVGLHVVASPGEASEPGYFLLMAAPTVEVDQVLPRDIMLVLDTSGSMEGGKLSQAKDALEFVLNHLNPEDRFNVVTFSTGVRHFAPGLQPAEKSAEAAAWVRTLEALGGTDINLALLEALHSRSEMDGDRPFVVLFLTDGLPTEGVTEIEQILDNVKSSSTAAVRLFPFGVGEDVNTVLLDGLAEQNRGVVSYVSSQSKINEEVSAYYARISTPVLADLTLDFEGVLVEELYPATLPDLYAGSQLILAGRFRNIEKADQTATVTLTGLAAGERQSYSAVVDFNTSDNEPARGGVIPRLWAVRKLGYLLTQIRLKGEQAEWVEAVINLSVRYGVITPYTSYLIEEDDIFSERGREAITEEWLEAEESAPVVGGDAVRQAASEGNLREAESAFMPAPEGEDERSRRAQLAVQVVGDKTFLLRDGIWMDTIFDPEEMDVLQIRFGSEGYYQLLELHPGWGRYYALGKRVIFVDEEQAYEIGLEEDPEMISRLLGPNPTRLVPDQGGDQGFFSPAPCSTVGWIALVLFQPLVSALTDYSMGKE